jgi:predicted DNA-binding transcriptional regulator YafY
MPAIKNALLRYRIIDRSIRNEYLPFPSKEQLRQTCEEEIFGSSEGAHICHSTIEKDIFSMRMDHDAPISYSKKERGYYYTDTSFSMDDVPLTEKDITAIKSASIILNQFKNTSLFGQYEFAIQKILDRAITSQKKHETEKEVIQFESLPTLRGNENLELFLDAIKSKNVVQFQYNSFIKDEKKVRRVHPYLLKEYRNRWYLIGKSEIKNKVITFGLDRIFDPIVLEQKYLLDNSFSPDLYFKHSLGITVYDQLPNEIIIQTNPILSKYLNSQPIHHSQKLVKLDNNGHHFFSLHLLITYELKMLLMGFGKDCKIIAPKELQEEILKDLQQSVNNYVNE